MNKELLEQIVKHIFANLLVIESPYVNKDLSKSLMTKEYLLNDHLSFDCNDEDKDIVKQNNIWGCQISTDNSEFKILLGDCSIDKYVSEYCLLVQLKDSPAYGVYITYTDSVFTEDFITEPLIACTLNSTDWLECNTYLQATFLAGMEQIKELGLSWNKCSNYKDQLNMMKSFIKYHASYYAESEL